MTFSGRDAIAAMANAGGAKPQDLSAVQAVLAGVLCVVHGPSLVLNPKYCIVSRPR